MTIRASFQLGETLHAGAFALDGDEFVVLAKKPEHVSRVFMRLFVGRDPDPARYRLIRIEAPRRGKDKVTP